MIRHITLMVLIISSLTVSIYIIDHYYTLLYIERLNEVSIYFIPA